MTSALRTSSLLQVHRSRARLRDVVAHVLPPENEGGRGMLLRLALSFDGIRVVIAPTGDDSLDVTATESAGECSRDEADSDVMIGSVAEAEPWRTAMGKPLLWSWCLTNQQGYDDGVQFEFAENVETDAVIVQILAVGGALWVRTLPSDLVRFELGS